MYRNNIIIYIVFLVMLLSRCIEPYIPHISSEASNKYVVSGRITDQEGYHFVSVSLSSPVDDPHYIPVRNCIVNILDDKGNTFPMEEIEDGKYRVWIDDQYLIPGTSYVLKINTPDGVEIESEPDQMPLCPEIDSVYHIREDLPTNDPLVDQMGIQFYINLDASDYDSHFFMWELEETWEYHVPYPREWYYDGEIHQIKPPDFSRKVCWSTKTVKNIYTLSTQNLSANVYQKFPLNFVDNKSARLHYGYSLLVKQYALSESAYYYWEQLRINSNEQGGMYSKQPLAIKGNMINVTNPDHSVLGFFDATSVKFKRVFASNIENLEIEDSPICAPLFLRFGFRDIEEREYPADFIWVNGAVYTLQEPCVNCLIFGGSNNKPIFWPN